MSNAIKAGAKALILINDSDQLILAGAGQNVTIPVFLVPKFLGDQFLISQPTLQMQAKNFNGIIYIHHIVE